MVGFVAVWFNKLQVDRVKLLQALAILTLFTTAVNLVTNRGVGDGVRLFQRVENVTTLFYHALHPTQKNKIAPQLDHLASLHMPGTLLNL